MKWKFREIQERHDSTINEGDEGLKSMKSFKRQLRSLVPRISEFLYPRVRVHSRWKSSGLKSCLKLLNC